MIAPAISFTGNVGNDPELRYTPNGHVVCDLRVASTPARRVGDAWEDRETLWFKVSCWGQLAENVAQSLKKGDRVVVNGLFYQQSYVREDGTAGVSLVVDAHGVGADIKRFPVEIKRTVRSGSSAELFQDKWHVNPETGEVLGEVTPEEVAV